MMSYPAEQPVQQNCRPGAAGRPQCAQTDSATSITLEGSATLALIALLDGQTPGRSIGLPVSLHSQHDVPLAGMQRRIGLVLALADQSEREDGGISRANRP